MPNVVTINDAVDTPMRNPNEAPANGVNDIESPYEGKSLFADSGSESKICTTNNRCPKYEMLEMKSPPELMAQSKMPTKLPQTTNSVPSGTAITTTNHPISGVNKKLVPKKTRACLAMINQSISADSNLFIQPGRIHKNKNLPTIIILVGRILAIPRKDQTDFIVQWAHMNKIPVGLNFGNLCTHISKFDLAAVALLQTAQRLHDDAHTEPPKNNTNRAKKE